MKKVLSILLVLVMLASLAGCVLVPDVSTPSAGSSGIPPASSSSIPPASSDGEQTIDEDGHYDSKEDVALYIHLYGKLPPNYMTKREATKAYGSYTKAMKAGICIGGDEFKNREGLLPKKTGRTWTECDIDTMGATERGAKRIVFSNDGLVYYTPDHYRTFQLLYGEIT